ncbi:MAG TPA: nitrophenyl compound nitroreductase subunit ArsF family protein [Bacteroidales bacterium]|nr:nitrophenyl compound nitroreductase subunit ArsF family protein [Bacteroidales bacterium]HSA42285.1 nitrophenyl compound nitroreductase subunit ArsF family protein [Bacteroidales bacterium]
MLFISVLITTSCHSSSDGPANDQSPQKEASAMPDSVAMPAAPQAKESTSEDTTKNTAVAGTSLPVVSVYNFHLTNRCASCIAIEEATAKTLELYFGDELKKGRIKRYVLNVDDKKNKKVSEKFQAFGSGIFLNRSFKGEEVSVDLTGDGFRYAKNKEEKFIEILKDNISGLLKP